MRSLRQRRTNSHGSPYRQRLRTQTPRARSNEVANGCQERSSALSAHRGALTRLPAGGADLAEPLSGLLDFVEMEEHIRHCHPARRRFVPTTAQQPTWRVSESHRWPIFLADEDHQGGWSWGCAASGAGATSTSG